MLGCPPLLAVCEFTGIAVVIVSIEHRIMMFRILPDMTMYCFCSVYLPLGRPSRLYQFIKSTSDIRVTCIHTVRAQDWLNILIL